MLDGARRVVINGHCSLFDQGNGFWTISGPFLGNVSLRILNAAVLRVCPSYILYIIYTVYIYIHSSSKSGYAGLNRRTSWKSFGGNPAASRRSPPALLGRRAKTIDERLTEKENTGGCCAGVFQQGRICEVFTQAYKSRDLN